MKQWEKIFDHANDEEIDNHIFQESSHLIPTNVYKGFVDLLSA